MMIRVSGGILTFEVLCFDITLANDVHRNLIQFLLKTFDLSLQVLNCLQSGLLVDIFIRLCHQKVNFLCLSIQFLPAELDCFVSLIAEGALEISLTRNIFKDDAILIRRELNLIFVHARRCVADCHALSVRFGHKVEAVRLIVI